MSTFVTPRPIPGLVGLPRLHRRHLALAMTLALLLGAIWILGGGGADEGADQASAVSPTGVIGGVTPRIGEPAPTFSLPTSSGQTLALADLRGRPVLLNFWATWCPPCRAEMPDLEDLAVERQPDGLVVLGVNMQEDRQSVQHYAGLLGLSFPLVLDSGGAVAERYNVTGLPTSYFIDRDGIVRAVNIGPLTPRGLRAKLARALD